MKQITTLQNELSEKLKECIEILDAHIEQYFFDDDEYIKTLEAAEIAETTLEKISSSFDIKKIKQLYANFDELSVELKTHETLINIQSFLKAIIENARFIKVEQLLQLQDEGKLKAQFIQWRNSLHEHIFQSIDENDHETILTDNIIATDTVMLIDRLLELPQSESISNDDLVKLASFFNQLPETTYTSVQNDLIAMQCGPQIIPETAKPAVSILTVDREQIAEPAYSVNTESASSYQELAQSTTVASPAADAPRTPPLLYSTSASPRAETPKAATTLEADPISTQRLDTMIKLIKFDLARLTNEVAKCSLKQTFLISSTITNQKIKMMKDFLKDIETHRKRDDKATVKEQWLSDKQLLENLLLTINSKGAEGRIAFTNFWDTINQQRNWLTPFGNSDCGEHLIKMAKHFAETDAQKFAQQNHNSAPLIMAPRF